MAAGAEHFGEQCINPLRIGRRKPRDPFGKVRQLVDAERNIGLAHGAGSVGTTSRVYRGGDRGVSFFPESKPGIR